jgi:integrase
MAKNTKPKVGKSTLFLQTKSPFYNLRVMVDGRRRQFSTGESSQAKAKDKAAAILADLKSRGLPETITLHSRRTDERPTDPSIDEFEKLYRKAMATTEYAPRLQTQSRYAASLRIVARTLNAHRIRQLTPKKIRKFIGDYQAQALEAGRAKNSVKVSLNSILRNAAAMFSKDALAAYKEADLEITNPFEGQKLRRVTIQGYSPLDPAILTDIWANSAKLRDGNRKAKKPKKADEDKGKRWVESDWRKPHPEAFILLMLELCVGLRRHEADKAQWDWIHKAGDNHFRLEVRETPYFIPKSGERRVIPVPAKLIKELERLKADDVFIVPGLQPKTYAPGKEPKNPVYRCDKNHRVLSQWLKTQGIDDPKPCHVLRKQFGSYVATTFGLYQAQKFLGHSSPKVTSDYYAGLTELPDLNHMEKIGE